MQEHTTKLRMLEAALEKAEEAEEAATQLADEARDELAVHLEPELLLP